MITGFCALLKKPGSHNQIFQKKWLTTMEVYANLKISFAHGEVHPPRELP